VRFAPPRLQDGLALVLAWHREQRDVLLDCRDPGVARLKLQWWRDELQRAYAGTAQHPLLRDLTPYLPGLPSAPMLAMSEAAEAEVRGARPADLPDLAARARQDQGSLFELLGRLQGLTDPAGLEELRRLGAYCGLVCLVRDLGSLVRRGRNPLSRDLWPQEEIHPDQGQALRPALETLVAHARGLRALRHGPAPLPACPAVLTDLRTALLAELERAGLPVLQQRIDLTPLYKLWRAWRTSRAR
jgi:phytoene synthase